MNNVSVSNNNNIISVTANATTSLFTTLCQFNMTSNNTLFAVKVLMRTTIRILFNITILLMLILFIYSLKLFKLIT